MVTRRRRRYKSYSGSHARQSGTSYTTIDSKEMIILCKCTHLCPSQVCSILRLSLLCTDTITCPCVSVDSRARKFVKKSDQSDIPVHVGDKLDSDVHIRSVIIIFSWLRLYENSMVEQVIACSCIQSNQTFSSRSQLRDQTDAHSSCLRLTTKWQTFVIGLWLNVVQNHIRVYSCFVWQFFFFC